MNRIDQRGISYQQFGKNLVKGLGNYNYNGLSKFFAANILNIILSN